MINKDYYSYYELLFSLRKEYLKNQKIINELLSHIKINSNTPDEYDSSLIFKENSWNNAASLLLVVRKRQSCIKLLLDSLYSSLVYGDYYYKSGIFSFTFRPSEEHVYLLDNNQDGRYLNTKVEVVNPRKFIELYKQLTKNVICKNSIAYLPFKDSFIQLSNNGIHLVNVENDFNESTKLDYNGLEDFIITNNASHLEHLMKLKINKSIIPDYFKSIIDNNMDNYSYNIEESRNKHEEFYTIEGHGKKLLLKPNKQSNNFIL